MISTALHLAVAALAYCLLDGSLQPLASAAALLLGLVPDIDTPKSIVGSLARSISVPLERRVGHRTATHSAPALALVAALTYLLTPGHWLALTAAYGSHLLLDLLIGRQGVQLFWPSGEFMTLTAWRDDGPAPRLLLGAALPALLITVSWGQLAPMLTPAVSAAARVANPIATPHPTPTPRPSVQLRFTLPPGVGLSALRVRRGDAIREGQVLASWAAVVPSPWPSPTAPAAPTAPPPPLDAPPALIAGELVEARAALAALRTAQGAAHAGLLAEQQRERAAAQRQAEAARRALDALQPRHERDQAEHQHAVEAARVELADAQAALGLAEGDAQAGQRAAERVHAAEAALTVALDAQERMRARHGSERGEADAALAEADAALAALPERHRLALARLEAEHAAERMLAAARVTRAEAQADAVGQARALEQRRTDATATALAALWRGAATATAQAHAVAQATTAQAWPTPAPSQVVSRAAGEIVTISAEEHDSQLVITIELIPTV